VVSIFVSISNDFAECINCAQMVWSYLLVFEIVMHSERQFGDTKIAEMEIGIG
jgi:hypothetical protein